MKTKEELVLFSNYDVEVEYLNFNLFNFIYFTTLLQVNCRKLRSVK